LFIPAFAAIFGLHFAVARGREQLAIGLLFGMGLLLGLAVAPVIADYAGADPPALWQAAGATAAFVAALGAYGYATRRDLSSWASSSTSSTSSCCCSTCSVASASKEGQRVGSARRRYAPSTLMIIRFERRPSNSQ
jgi:FtsH-binding integral membrane protein